MKANDSQGSGEQASVQDSSLRSLQRAPSREKCVQILRQAPLNPKANENDGKTARPTYPSGNSYIYGKSTFQIEKSIL